MGDADSLRGPTDRRGARRARAAGARRGGLLDGGATVPFIARYRKEVTGGSTTRSCARSRSGCATCASSRSAGPRSSKSSRQGKLDDALRRRSSPPTPRRGWKTSTCRTSPSGAPRPRSPARPAWSRWPTRCSPTRPGPAGGGRRTSSTRKGVPDAAAALDGARAILVERSARTPTWSASCASGCGSAASSSRKVREGKEEAGAKFADYFDFAEPFAEMPSHRIAGAVPRREGGGPRPRSTRSPRTPTGAAHVRAGYEARIAAALRHRGPAAARPMRWLPDTVRWAWRTRILIHLGLDLRMRLWQARRGRSGPRVRGEPPRPAARRPAGAGPRWAWTRASAPASRSRSSTPPARSSRPTTIYPHEPQPPLGRVAWRSLAKLAAAAPGGPDRHRQRHRLAGDRQARRRADREAPRAEADQGRWSPRPAPRSTPPPSSPRRSCPSSTCRCAARSRSRAACRTRSPSWSRSTRSRSASASTSTTWPR